MSTSAGSVAGVSIDELEKTSAGLDRGADVQEVHVEEHSSKRYTLEKFLKTSIKLGASDIHLQTGSVPMMRIDGRARFLDVDEMEQDLMEQYVKQLVTEEEKQKNLAELGSCDTSYALPDGSARFRVATFHSRGELAIVMRRIVTKIPHFEDLNLPPQIEKLSDVHRGLVLVSGTTGSGKSTSLAAVIGKINRTRNERIITVEDPIEYQHEDGKSLVSQVEVGSDSESYAHALRAAMRQDPDVMLVGEIRDSFSLGTALRAADTGHLVFTTVHATNAPMTIERVVSLFDPAQRELQQTQLATNLVAIVCQRLAKRRDGKGRVPVVEIMQATPLVRKYILEGEFEKLKGCVGNREAGSQ
ncbi:MAG: PilT/PilU family type 4a pilus ATPase, partial [Planctomycetota bacterium]